LADQIETLISTGAAAQAHWGISVTALDGRVLYEKNDAKLFAPASNAKLFTTAAALALIGPQTTIQTQVVAASALDAQGTIHGDVTLMGAGDATISGRTYPYDGKTERPNPPLNALAALADQIQQRGVRRIEGNIVGDDTAFPWQPYANGWAWDNLQWGFGAPVSALTVNDNVVYLSVAPGSRPGDPLTFSWNPPEAAAYYQIQNQGRTSATGSQSSLGLDRPLGSNETRIFGTLPAGSAARSVALAVHDPAAFAAIAFRQMLESRGIVVTGDAIAHHRFSDDTSIYEQSVLRPLTLPANAGSVSFMAPTLPPGAIVLASRTSVPLVQDIAVINKVSQNLHAEVLLRLLGKQDGADGSTVEGARVVRAFAARAGIVGQDFFFYDGSGLSPEDRVTPRALTTLIRYAAGQPWGPQFRSTLPVGGVDGTLSDRFMRSPLRGRVFAKTGTLDEVNSLSGYLTAASGQTVAFSILCNGHLPGAGGFAGTIDRIAEAIAASE
jgi:D-alanyl-D-alanine carboxypeptidase/D-alanyl-D-alanine-endopeptidase (penicillin-binding protein 4)